MPVSQAELQRRIDKAQTALKILRADALARDGKLVVEAGTGTGKTFAYLLPALMSGRKTIISTGTKALQDQLYHRDLPLIGKAVGRPVTTALLKGRANYPGRRPEGSS
jgi:ATP-dependent DNA helicase DinG